MEYKTLICTTCIFFCFYTAQSCISKKVKVIGGEIYEVGLFSINITENQPDIRRSDAFGKHALKTRNSYLIKDNSYVVSFGYTAYEMCNDKTFTKEVALSLLLDEEYNLSDSEASGKTTRVATIFTHISTSLTKLLLELFSFEDIHIVSQFSEHQVFKNKMDLVPFYCPSKLDLAPAMQINNIAKLYSSNHVVVICLTNEKHFVQVCNGVIEVLSNEANSCFSIKKVYTKNNLGEVVRSIALKDKHKTIIIVIGKDEHQQNLMDNLVKNKISGRNIISYGFSVDYFYKDCSNYCNKWIFQYTSTFDNETINNVFKDLKILLSNALTFTLEYKESDFIFNTFYKNVTNDKILSFEFDDDARYYMFISNPEVVNYTTFQLINYVKQSMASWLEVSGIYDIEKYIYSSYGPTYDDNLIVLISNHINGKEYAFIESTEFSCTTKICNASHEPYLLKTSYGDWNYTKKWICQKCGEDFIQPNNDVNTSCVPCPIFFSSNVNNTKCVDSYTEIYLSLKNHTIFIPISISIVSIIMMLITFLVFIKFSESKEIKASNKTMTSVQLAVFLVFFISFPVLMIGRPSSIKCHTRTMIFGYTFNVVASILLVKSNKLLKIFNADIKFTKSEIRNSKLIDILVIMAFVMLETVLYFTMIVTMPPEVKVVHQTESKEKHMFCSNNNYFVINIVVKFVSFFASIVQCFRIRRLPSVFNEAREILHATLMADFIFALTLLLYYSRSNENEKDYVIILMLSIMAASFYFLLFYKKMLLIFQHKRMKSKAAALKQPKRLTDMKI